MSHWKVLSEWGPDPEYTKKIYQVSISADTTLTSNLYLQIYQKVVNLFVTFTLNQWCPLFWLGSNRIIYMCIIKHSRQNGSSQTWWTEYAVCFKTLAVNVTFYYTINPSKPYTATKGPYTHTQKRESSNPDIIQSLFDGKWICFSRLASGIILDVLVITKENMKKVTCLIVSHLHYWTVESTIWMTTEFTQKSQLTWKKEKNITD